MKRHHPSPQGYSDPISAYCTGRQEHDWQLERTRIACQHALDMEDAIFAGIGVGHSLGLAMARAMGIRNELQDNARG